MFEGVFTKWHGLPESDDRLLTIVRLNADKTLNKVILTRKEAQEVVQALEDEEFRIKGKQVQ